MKLKDWIEKLKEQYDSRELEYMEVEKALIQLQLKDVETDTLHIRNSTYKAKDAANITGIILEGGEK